VLEAVRECQAEESEIDRRGQEYGPERRPNGRARACEAQADEDGGGERPAEADVDSDAVEEIEGTRGALDAKRIGWARRT
jgi:hypothetical protein